MNLEKNPTNVWDTKMKIYAVIYATVVIVLSIMYLCSVADDKATEKQPIINHCHHCHCK